MLGLFFHSFDVDQKHLLLGMKSLLLISYNTESPGPGFDYSSHAVVSCGIHWSLLINIEKHDMFALALAGYLNSMID